MDNAGIINYTSITVEIVVGDDATRYGKARLEANSSHGTASLSPGNQVANKANLKMRPTSFLHDTPALFGKDGQPYLEQIPYTT